MTVEASAPARCGILGNPSDIYGGRVLSCSVPVRATCRLEASERDELPEDLRLWNAAIARLPLETPVRVTWKTDIPRSSGISGSTALLAATIACVRAMRRDPIALDTPEQRIQVAEFVRDVELRDAQVVCGYQDAYMIVHGGLNYLNFAGKHPVDSGPPGQVTPVSARLPFLLVTTGVERLSGSVHGPMRERWLRGDREVIQAMERFADLADVGLRALPAEDWATLAKAMDDNQALIRSLGGSGEAVDRLIDCCKRAGALSAKLAGAGLGGTIIALTHDPDALEAALREMGYTRFLRPALAPGLRYERMPGSW